MATILIWMAPEPSHILPTIKLARDLQLLNHQVIYLTSRSLHGQLNRFGFSCHLFLNGLLDGDTSDGLYSMTSSAIQWRDILLSRFAEDPKAAYKAISSDIEKAAIAVGADLILIDSLMNYLHGVLPLGAAQPKWQVGFIQAHLPVVLFSRNTDQAQRMLSRLRRTIILCPQEIELPNYRIAEARYAEACIHLDRGEIEFPWNWLEPGRKLIYCAMGSQSSALLQAPQIFKAVMEVAKRMPDYQFVIAAGPHYQELRAINSSSNCVIVAAVPQTSLLEKAAAMILHGGLGSIKECIYFGVPMLVLPIVHDQPLNALRVQRHGLAISMPPHKATSCEIYAALRRLLEDQSVYCRVMKMQALFREREEKKIAAGICEEFLLSRVGS